MSQVTMKIARGVAVGIAIGSAIGAASVYAMRPKKSRLKKTAGRALDAVGSIMQNMSDWAF